MENQREHKLFSAIKKGDIYPHTTKSTSPFKQYFPIIQLCIFLYRHGNSQSAGSISTVLFALRHFPGKYRKNNKTFLSCIHTVGLLKIIFKIFLFETSLFPHLLKRNLTKTCLVV